MNQVLFNHRSLSKVGHCRPLLHLIGHASTLRVRPIVACLLQLGDPLLQSFLLTYQVLDLIERVFAGEVFKDHEALSQVFILVLQLEDLCVLVVDELRLFLDGFAEAQVPLQHLLHHVHGVDDPPRDRVFRFIGSVVSAARRSHGTGRPDSIRINPIDFFSVRPDAAAPNSSVLLLQLIGFLSHCRVLPLQEFVVAGRSVMAAT